MLNSQSFSTRITFGRLCRDKTDGMDWLSDDVNDLERFLESVGVLVLGSLDIALTCR